MTDCVGAVFRGFNGNVDIWLLETGPGVLTRFAFDSGDDVYPVVSPDGSRIVFTSNRKGGQSLYLKSVTGQGSEGPLLAAERLTPVDWSPV